MAAAWLFGGMLAGVLTTGTYMITRSHYHKGRSQQWKELEKKPWEPRKYQAAFRLYEREVLDCQIHGKVEIFERKEERGTYSLDCLSEDELVDGRVWTTEPGFVGWFSTDEKPQLSINHVEPMAIQAAIERLKAGK